MKKKRNTSSVVNSPKFGLKKNRLVGKIGVSKQFVNKIKDLIRSSSCEDEDKENKVNKEIRIEKNEIEVSDGKGKGKEGEVKGRKVFAEIKEMEDSVVSDSLRNSFIFL